MQLAIFSVFLIFLYVPPIANTDLENDENRIDQILPDDLLLSCALNLYLFYPLIKDTTELLQLLIGISYSTGLCFALILAYPFYRVSPRLDHLWRGWAFELTHWNCLEYEFLVLRLYATFSLSMFLRMPLVILAFSLLFARLRLRYRITSVLLVASISYFWWYNVLTSGPLYELQKLSWTGCLVSIIVFVCSSNNAMIISDLFFDQ